MRDSVSLGYPNTEKRVEDTMRSGVFLTNSRYLDSPCHGGLSRVFDIVSPQSKQNLWSKRRNKIVKSYAS